MPKVGYIEKTIRNIERVKVHFMKNEKNVRSEVVLSENYKAINMTKNSANVSFLKEKLQKQYPGYDFEVYDGNGKKANGRMLLGNLRDTYIEEE